MYVQRGSPAGAMLWPADGVALITAPNDQFGPDMVMDGDGGAIAVWTDNRGGSYQVSDVYARIVDAAGVPQGIADGVAVCTAASHRHPEDGDRPLTRATHCPGNTEITDAPRDIAMQSSRNRDHDGTHAGASRSRLDIRRHVRYNHERTLVNVREKTAMTSGKGGPP